MKKFHKMSLCRLDLFGRAPDPGLASKTERESKDGILQLLFFFPAQPWTQVGCGPHGPADQAQSTAAHFGLLASSSNQIAAFSPVHLPSANSFLPRGGLHSSTAPHSGSLRATACKSILFCLQILRKVFDLAMSSRVKMCSHNFQLNSITPLYL